MGQKTIYGVQAYWHDGRRLARGVAEQFKTMGEAERVAAKLYENHAGVLIYSVTGNPDFDAWEEPRRLSAVGLVPLYADLA